MKRQAPGWRDSFEMRDGRGRGRSSEDGSRGRRQDFRRSQSQSFSPVDSYPQLRLILLASGECGKSDTAWRA